MLGEQTDKASKENTGCQVPKRRPWYQRGEDLEGSERKMSEGDLGRRTYRRRFEGVTLTGIYSPWKELGFSSGSPES